MLLFLMDDDDLGDQSHNDDFPLVVLVLIFTVDFDENMCPTSAFLRFFQNGPDLDPVLTFGDPWSAIVDWRQE